MATKAYEGDGVTIHFDARRCIHAAACVNGLPGVFDPHSRPWIKAGGGSPEEIVSVVEQCPSGALTYTRTDGGAAEVAPAERTIQAVADGPLYVRGSLDVCDPDGKTISAGPRVALCRCGASKNKPYCDNSHIEAGFKDAD